MAKKNEFYYNFFMRIYFHRYNSISEAGILDAFNALGFEVYQDCSEIERKIIPPEERVNTLATALLTLKKTGAPFDCVFSVNFFPHIARVCNKLETPYYALTVDCPVLESFSESIALPCCRIFLFDKCHYELLRKYSPHTVFHMPLGADPKLRVGMSGKESAYPEINEKNAYTPVMAKAENCISLVGSLYLEKSPLHLIKDYLSEHTTGFLQGVMDAQEELYGINVLSDCLSDAMISEIRKAAEKAENSLEQYRGKFWPKLSDPICAEELLDRYIVSHYYLAPELAFRSRVHLLNALADHFDTRLFTASPIEGTGLSDKVKVYPPVSSYRGMPNVFSHSAINLQPTLRSIETGLSQRVFDVLMCGGFLMSNYQEEIYEHFTPGKELAVYGSTEELMELCGYYLSHPEERQEIAAAGCRKVRESHTWEHRIKVMFDMSYDQP